MRRAELPITALPAWSKLNDVNFLDIDVNDLGGSKGFGLATERALSSKDTFDTPTLLIIPHDLILSAEAIEEHGKVDKHFKQLLDVAGGKVLFLSIQVTVMRLKGMRLIRRIVVEGRCSSLPVDADHDCGSGSWSKCRAFKSLDGVCEDAPKSCSCSNDVD
jgi:hypothetical protein